MYPPNYAKVDPNSFNNSVFAPTAPDNKLGLASENHSLLIHNQTWMININQTLSELIQTLVLRNISSETNREHLNTSQVGRVMAAVPYCDRTVYLFAFWTTTLVYVFAGNALVIIICLYGFMTITNKLIEFVTT